MPNFLMFFDSTPSNTPTLGRSYEIITQQNDHSYSSILNMSFTPHFQTDESTLALINENSGRVQVFERGVWELLWHLCCVSQMLKL